MKIEEKIQVELSETEIIEILSEYLLEKKNLTVNGHFIHFREEFDETDWRCEYPPDTVLGSITLYCQK